MAKRGYIALDRGIFDHHIFRRRQDWLIAWQRLIAAAAWKPVGQRTDHGVVHVERGQVAITLRGLGISWGWPKSNVDCFLKRLAREDMVVLEKTRTRTRTSTRTLSHPVTIITICNYEKFQAVAARAEKPGQEPGRDPGQGMQEVLPLQGLPVSEPTNHQTKDLRGVEKNGDKSQASKKTRPRHGQRAHGRVFWNYDTSEWHVYADAFEQVKGAAPMPSIYLNGKGRWFKEHGETGRAADLWTAERIARFA